MKKLLGLIIIIGLFGCSQIKKKDFTKYVNPFIGAADNGHTFPGACAPFGMIQASPVTGAIGWRYCSEYVNTDTLIWGFTQTHLNGTGCMDLGDILMMPFCGKRVRDWDDYKSRFLKNQEKAEVGYYCVNLIDSKAKVELTASTHVAFHKYTFNYNDTTSVLIDLQHAPAWNENQYHSQVKECWVKREDSNTIVGYVNNMVWIDQKYYFVIQFNQPISDIKFLKMGDDEKGKRIVATFNLPPDRKLLAKISISTTSVEGAKNNMESEVPHWNFDLLNKQTKDLWNSYLGRVEVIGDEDKKVNYYTSLYHALIQPNKISDVDGMYRNCNGDIVKSTSGEFYSTFSLWDTYRAAHPFYTIIIPDKVDAFINSLIDQGEAQGFLPIWALWGKETYCMIGNHAVSVISEAYNKGFRGFDLHRAFNIIERTQTVSHKQKSDWETYMQYGYFPADIIKNESVSATLESVYDCYAASVMAKLMGLTEKAEYFTNRSNFYKNLFDKQTNFMRPRNSDSTWKTPFNPNDIAHAESIGGDYTEGNAWQYTWHVQHDIPGLIDLFGGKEIFIKKLDSLFVLKLNTTQADVTGLIGQYAHGNEPSHHIAYLFTMADKPKRTQELIRQIFDTQYKPLPDGLCGNDDCGQMSAWYMFSAMGFYPVDPVSGKYIFGAPQFPKIVLHLQNGKTFTIIAENISNENKYVEGITLNGLVYDKNYIEHSTILQGGELIFKMNNN